MINYNSLPLTTFYFLNNIYNHRSNMAASILDNINNKIYFEKKIPPSISSAQNQLNTNQDVIKQRLLRVALFTERTIPISRVSMILQQ